jgi:hypothetical protein
MYTETFGSALALRGNATIRSLTVVSCTGSTAVIDSEPGTQAIEYGNFIANTVLESIVGSLATVTANYNGLSMSHCYFAENGKDIAGPFEDDGRPFSLSYCFFSDSFPDTANFTIVTECYEKISTASWEMQAPTHDTGVCEPPCTPRLDSPETFPEPGAGTAARSPSWADSLSETVSDSAGETLSASPPELPSESPTEGPSQTPSDDAIQSASDSVPDTPSHSPEDSPSESPDESPSDTLPQSASDSVPDTASPSPEDSPSESPDESPLESVAVTPVDTPPSSPEERKRSESLSETFPDAPSAVQSALRFVSVSISSSQTVVHLTLQSPPDSLSDCADQPKVLISFSRSPSDDSSSTSGADIGLIIGIVIGVIAAICGGVAAVFVWLHRPTPNSQPAENEMSTGNFSALESEQLATYANALSDGPMMLWRDDADEVV